jgi:hypothetical protein
VSVRRGRATRACGLLVRRGMFSIALMIPPLPPSWYALPTGLLTCVYLPPSWYALTCMYLPSFLATVQTTRPLGHVRSSDSRALRNLVICGCALLHVCSQYMWL